MKKKRPWVVAFIVGLLFVGILTVIKRTQKNETIANPTQSIASEAPQRETNQGSTVTSSGASLPAQPRLPTMTHEQKMELAPGYMNVPINFYGRVVDQDGHPLSGVRIVISVRQWFHAAPTVNSVFPQTELVSDVNGDFQFQNGAGDSLSIKALEKEGYEPEPNAMRSFGYTTSDPLRPDPNNPILFRLWKSEVKEQLVTGKMFFAIWPDGRDYTVNLIDGTQVETSTGDGDFRVRVKRPADATFGQRYDWSFTITPLNGGIVEEQDARASMYLAPSTGYLAEYEFTVKAEAEQWGRRIKKGSIYIRSRSGMVVGRLTLDCLFVL